MQQMFGADSAALRVLAGKLDQLASRLVAIEGSTSSKVSTMAWRGPDADRFRNGWTGGASQSMRDAAANLGAAADSIRSDAHRQDQASAL